MALVNLVAKHFKDKKEVLRVALWELPDFFPNFQRDTRQVLDVVVMVRNIVLARVVGFRIFPEIHLGSIRSFVLSAIAFAHTNFGHFGDRLGTKIWSSLQEVLKPIFAGVQI